MWQLLLVAVCSVIFLALGSVFQALSVWAGGFIAFGNAQWLEWRRSRVEQGRVLSAGESIRVLYRTALERFVLVALLFALCLGVLDLDPLALLTGFIAGQLALFTMGRDRNKG